MVEDFTGIIIDLDLITMVGMRRDAWQTTGTREYMAINMLRGFERTYRHFVEAPEVASISSLNAVQSRTLELQLILIFLLVQKSIQNCVSCPFDRQFK